MFRHSPIYDASMCAILCVLMPSIGLAGDTLQDDESDSIVAGLVAIESDMAAIEGVLQSFNEAVRAGDQEAALAQINPDARDRFESLIEAMGTHAQKWATNWKDLTPIDIGDEVAVYAFIQIEDGKERGYSIVFVRHPKLGWLIQQL